MSVTCGGSLRGSSRRALRTARVVGALGLMCVLLAACPPRVDPDTYEPPPVEARAEVATEEVDLVLGGAFEGAELRGRAGGLSLATSLDDACVGMVPSVPQHRFEVDAERPLTLRASPHGTGFVDLTMAVRGPDGGVRCADDGRTLDPVMTGIFGPGLHEVFVGEAGSDRPPYLFTIQAGIHEDPPLSVGTLFPPPIPDGDPPEALEEGTQGGVRITGRTAPARLEGVAGGTRRARDFGPDCAGFVAMAPDHVVELTGPAELTLRVRSNGDTTMAIQGPNESIFCRDDDDGLDPVLRRMLPSGRYHVYVGSYAADESPEYTLTISR